MPNNYSGLINFEVKSSSSETFFDMNSVLYVQIMFLKKTLNIQHIKKGL